MAKKQHFQTDLISFDEFMAQGDPGRPVSEIAAELRATEAEARKKERELKKAHQLKKRQQKLK